MRDQQWQCASWAWRQAHPSATQRNLLRPAPAPRTRLFCQYHQHPSCTHRGGARERRPVGERLAVRVSGQERDRCSARCLCESNVNEGTRRASACQWRSGDALGYTWGAHPWAFERAESDQISVLTRHSSQIPFDGSLGEVRRGNREAFLQPWRRGDSGRERWPPCDVLLAAHVLPCCACCRGRTLTRDQTAWSALSEGTAALRTVSPRDCWETAAVVFQASRWRSSAIEVTAALPGACCRTHSGGVERCAAVGAAVAGGGDTRVVAPWLSPANCSARHARAPHLS
jgi:hypothetical protein